MKVNQQIALTDIPARARRRHPSWGDCQVLTGFILHEILEPERPADALAYVALTASDLWPGRGWNFVFGEANLRERVGVWSIYRNGDPNRDFPLCLRRTLATATHETGHILGLWHCTAYRCLMNGSNHQEERDRRSASPVSRLPAEALLELAGRASRLPGEVEGFLPKARPRP